MSLIPQCNEFTTMATLMNGMDTVPSHCDKATVTLTVAMMAKLLDWANTLASDSDIYQVIENMTSMNLSSVIDINDWNIIVPNCDNADEEEEIVAEPEEEEFVIELPQEEAQPEPQPEEPVINDLFNDYEADGKEALRQYQARFNIVPEEPSIENPVIDNDGLTPELEKEIEQIIAIANN